MSLKLHCLFVWLSCDEGGNSFWLSRGLHSPMKNHTTKKKKKQRRKNYIVHKSNETKRHLLNIEIFTLKMLIKMNVCLPFFFILNEISKYDMLLQFYITSLSAVRALRLFLFYSTIKKLDWAEEQEWANIKKKKKKIIRFFRRETRATIWNSKKWFNLNFIALSKLLSLKWKIVQGFCSCQPHIFVCTWITEF